MTCFVGLDVSMEETAYCARNAGGRILGQGDVVALVEKAAADFDQAEAEKTARKLAKGQFDLDDLANQLRQVDVLVSQGRTVADAVRSIGVTEVTWRN